MIVKVALRNGYNVYGRVVEENSSSIRLVAQRELIPEMRIGSYPLFERHRRNNCH